MDCLKLCFKLFKGILTNDNTHYLLYFVLTLPSQHSIQFCTLLRHTRYHRQQGARLILAATDLTIVSDKVGRKR